LIVMKKRVRSSVAVLALLALAVLLLRPVALNSFGSPFGAHHSPNVQFAYADDSPHCGLLADCEMVSFVTTGLAAPIAAGLLILAGIMRHVSFARVRIPHSWTALVPVPPPLATPS
jgi:hypothetical protein